MKRFLILTAGLAAMAVAGCTGESAFPEATGKGSVRAINMIATSPAITFLIEERTIGSVEYKTASTSVPYDDLDYTFNFDAVFPDTGRERVASLFVDIVADRNYTFVISGDLASPTIDLWEADIRTFAETDTVFEMRFGHTATTLGDIDVYFAAAGIAPALGEQAATLSIGQVSEPADFPEGEYILIYTTAGDPGAVLFTSDTIIPEVRSAVTVSIFDGDPNDLGPLAVRYFPDNGGTLTVTDVGLMSTLRFFQTSLTLDTADVYNEETLTMPLVTDHAFGDITGDIPIDVGINALTYTAAGDTNVVLFDGQAAISTGTHNNFYLIGEAGALGSITVIQDRRPVETLVKFSILHAAINHTTVDLYIVEADADIAELPPLFFSVPAGTAPINTSLQAGSFDLYLTTPGEKTLIAGPVRLDVELGDIVNLMVLDNVDPAIADIVFVPDP